MSYRRSQRFRSCSFLVAIGSSPRCPRARTPVLLRVARRGGEGARAGGASARRRSSSHRGITCAEGTVSTRLCYALLLSRDLWFYAPPALRRRHRDRARRFIASRTSRSSQERGRSRRAWEMAGLELPGRPRCAAWPRGRRRRFAPLRRTRRAGGRKAVGGPPRSPLAVVPSGRSPSRSRACARRLDGDRLRSGNTPLALALLTGSLLAWLLYDAVLSSRTSCTSRTPRRSTRR